MIIYPAIDLLDGQCVRLWQGDFTRKTIYQSSPLEQAKTFSKSGAKWLHLVDLSAAKSGINTSIPSLSLITSLTDLKVQFGGGIRSLNDAQKIIKAGASRVVLGSLAIEHPEDCKKITDSLGPDKVAIALDFVRSTDGNIYPKSRGWTCQSQICIFTLIRKHLDFGVRNFIFTNIERDGTGSGPDWLFYRCLSETYPDCRFIVSGGVNSCEDIQMAKSTGASGLIIGKYLYSKTIDLREVLLAV